MQEVRRSRWSPAWTRLPCRKLWEALLRMLDLACPLEEVGAARIA